MPQVKSLLEINAPFETVWRLAQDVESFPSIMPDLEKVTVLEETRPSPETKRTVTEWNARIRQFNRSIVWTEEDLWNSQTRECRFWQLKGDFTQYEGVWKFKPRDQSTEIELIVDYTFEIPLIGALMKNVLQKLMQANSDMMTQSLKKESERLAQ